jgi:hypothetical protein
MAEKLHLHPLFQIKAELLPNEERVALSYKRAKLVLLSFRMSHTFYVGLVVADDLLSHT